MVRGITGGRWARPLVMLACLSCLARAQVRSCVPAPAWWLPSTHYSAPGFVLWRSDSLWVLGSPSSEIRPDERGRPFIADTSFAGILVLPNGTVRKIPWPGDARDMLHPRGTYDPRGPEVLWGEALPSAPRPRPLSVMHRLRVARLAGDRWTSVTEIGDVDNELSFARSTASDVVRSASGVRYFVFRTDLDANWSQHLGVASDSGGRWRIHAFALPMASFAAFDLAFDAERLTVLFAGLPRTIPPGRGSYHQSLWMSRLESDGWSVPVNVAGDGSVGIGSPRLLPSPTGLIAAWVVRDAEPVLQWQRFESGRLTGPVNHLAGVGLIWSGQDPYRDLISAIAPDGSARILRLRADGYDLIAEIPTLSGMPPTIAQVRGQPWAFTAERHQVPDPGTIHLVAYDLHCAVLRRGVESTR